VADGAATLDLGGSGEDNRNQGFVGATAPGVTENTFVGAASQTFGALADDATFGGGVNDGTPSSIPSGAGGGGGLANSIATCLRSTNCLSAGYRKQFLQQPLAPTIGSIADRSLPSHNSKQNCDRVGCGQYSGRCRSLDSPVASTTGHLRNCKSVANNPVKNFDGASLALFVSTFYPVHRTSAAKLRTNLPSLKIPS